MSGPTWGLDVAQPDPPRISAFGYVLAALRVPLLVVVNFGCLILLLLIRVIERPLFGVARPVTPWITQFVCRASLLILGIRQEVRGKPISGGGAMVANHSSWLDIYALNSASRLYFVSKAEVAGWVGIGWLARATGTVFIERVRGQASAHVALIGARLNAGHKLLFFPEGTSTDGRRVLPFKTTLFAAFVDPELRDAALIQPVTLDYRSPKGADPRFYGWWGTADFGPHLLAVLTRTKQGRISVTYHSPIDASEVTDRKELAAQAEAAVRSALTGAD